MANNRYYYYDPESCAFVEVKPKRTKLYVIGALSLVVTLVLAAGLTWGVDQFLGTPEEIALQTENEALQEQFELAQQRLEALAGQLDQLSEADQEIYRTLLQANQISEDVRQAGVGGADAYEAFDAFSPDAAEVLRRTAEKLDQLELQISLQNESYRELAELAEAREASLKELPTIMPVNGPLVSSYGIRNHPIDKVPKMHPGVDFLVNVGTPVHVTADGVVKRTGRDRGYGRFVEIAHPASGYTTLYGHLSSIPRHIRKGRKVKRGEQIALSGNTGRSTGPHLHYEVRKLEGGTLNPIYFFAPSMTPDAYKELLEEADRATVSLDW